MSKNDSDNLDILLETGELKQESVLSNIRSLDIKASIILAFFGVLLIPSVEIFRWTIINKKLIYLKFFPGLIIIIGILFCLLALIPQKLYSYPRLSGLRSLYHQGINPDQLKAELISYYELACIENEKISKKKLFLIKTTYIFLALSFIIIMLLYIFKGEIDG
jgi:hypothetical protein